MFAKVFGEVIEFQITRAIQILDQFPIAFTNRAGGAIVMVVWVVPMNGIAL